MLKIPFCTVGAGINDLPLISIGNDSWPQFADGKTTASFTASHYGTGMRIRFVVEEPYLHVRKRTHNGDVHLDNCVEFFVAFDHTGYYNFEFNCLGSIRVGFGSGRLDREHLKDDLIDVIARALKVEINNLINGCIHWELEVNIPAESFWRHQIDNVAGKTCTANFYKCGDELPVPHFKSWQPIDSPQPDFHRPEAFGQISFMHPSA